jgi:glycosyltransferase involved in cell wall biosynthesis
MDSEIVIMVAGNRRPEKNHGNAALALGCLLRMPPGKFHQRLVRVIVYTDSAGPEWTTLALEFPGRVSLIEGQVVTPDHFDLADMVLHPSTSESNPRVVLEALARGCAVLVGSTWRTPNFGATYVAGDAPAGICSALTSALCSTDLKDARHLRRIRAGGGLRSVDDYAIELLASIRNLTADPHPSRHLQD